MAHVSRSTGYQVGLALLLSFNFGIVFFDRNALNYLMPFVSKDLDLNNTEIGMLAAALSGTWAISGFILGSLSDRAGRRKIVLVLSIIAFSSCSILSGFASSFAMLFATRLLMGAAEGPVLPLSQSLVSTEITGRHRGLAMGFVQNFGSNLLSGFVGPIVLVAIAQAYGWRPAFWLTGLPGLFCALCIAFFVREPAADPQQSDKNEPGIFAFNRLAPLFVDRNITLCALISVVLIGAMVIIVSFLPLYLTRARGISPPTMSWIMAGLGISAAFGSVFMSSLSDRVGRKPVMILAPMLGMTLPIVAMYYQGPLWGMAALFYIGWLMLGCFPLFMATIPSETVDPRLIATTLALIMGLGEVIGGVGGPLLAGMVGDVLGLSGALWIAYGLAACGLLLALGLRETLNQSAKSRLSPN